MRLDFVNTEVRLWFS